MITPPSSPKRINIKRMNDDVWDISYIQYTEPMWSSLLEYGVSQDTINTLILKGFNKETILFCTEHPEFFLDENLNPDDISNIVLWVLHEEGFV